MAARANIEGAEKGLMKIKQKNPDGKNKKETEKMVKLKLDTTEKVEMKKIMVLEEPHQLSWFKQKAASVFLAKRKSVKRMIFDRLVVYFGSVVSHSSPSSSSAVGVASKPHKPKTPNTTTTTNTKEEQLITYPLPTKPVVIHII